MASGGIRWLLILPSRCHIAYLGVGAGESWSKEIAVCRRFCATPQTLDHWSGQEECLQHETAMILMVHIDAPNSSGFGMLQVVRDLRSHLFASIW